MVNSEQLTAERLLRAAVRDSNRLFAGSRVGVRIADARVAENVRATLQHLGAHLCDEHAGELDFWVSGDPNDGAAQLRSAGQRIEDAAQLMAATQAVAAEMRASEVCVGRRIALSLVLEPKTAVLALALQKAGALVHVFGAVSETQPAVAAALAEHGILVSAPLSEASEDPDERDRIDAVHAAAVLDWLPELLIDDGAHLIRLAHTRNSGAALGSLLAASEETTSGVRPLREMDSLGELRIPVVAVNDARTKTEFDNRIGTGESCVLAIADALDSDPPRKGLRVGVAGAQWVVLGYGPVGVGVARVARALGAHVSIVETDAVRALAALYEGFAVAPKADALPAADVVVSATGVWHTLTASDFDHLRPGAAVAVAGGIDDELALDELRAHGWVPEADTNAHSAQLWRSPEPAAGGAGGVFVLAGGRGVNYTIADGNPIEVMDLSFATQLAALSWLSEEHAAAGVYVLPRSAEERVARAALVSRGIHVDVPGETVIGGAAQSWRVHRYQQPTQ